MPLRLHPDSDQLSARLQKMIAAARRWHDVVFRFVEPIYATERDLLTGEGSRIHGGRWNPKNSFATVYAALEDSTALAESKAAFAYYGWDQADALPRTLVAIDVQLHRVLDLTDGAS